MWYWVVDSNMYFCLKPKVNFTVNSKTGAIQSMNIDNDKQNMNWLIATDGSQYPWITENTVGDWDISPLRVKIKK